MKTVAGIVMWVTILRSAVEAFRPRRVEEAGVVDTYTIVVFPIRCRVQINPQGARALRWWMVSVATFGAWSAL